MRDPKHPQRFTKTFKRDIVSRYDAGQTVKELSETHNVAPSCIYRWIGAFHDAANSPKTSQGQIQNGSNSPEELLEFYKKQNEKLQLEVDILKQAALIFAQRCRS